MSKQLSERELKVLKYIKNEILQKGYPPTVREMCSSLGIKSTSTVHKDLDALEKKGYIRKNPSKPRAIEILETEVTKKEENTEHHTNYRPDIVEVPLVGRIAAGQPILADQNYEDSFPVPTSFIGKGNHFMLTVKGDSMIEAGIFDKDYILVEQKSTAYNGEIVVAMIDGIESEATVKTFYKEKNHIRLQPENASLDPIIVKDAKILGVVKGVFRKLQ